MGVLPEIIEKPKPIATEEARQRFLKGSGEDLFPHRTAVLGLAIIASDQGQELVRTQSRRHRRTVLRLHCGQETLFRGQLLFGSQMAPSTSIAHNGKLIAKVEAKR